MTVRDIEDHLLDIYGIDVSPDLSSNLVGVPVPGGQRPLFPFGSPPRTARPKGAFFSNGANSPARRPAPAPARSARTAMRSGHVTGLGRPMDARPRGVVDFAIASKIRSGTVVWRRRFPMSVRSGGKGRVDRDDACSLPPQGRGDHSDRPGAVQRAARITQMRARPAASTGGCPARAKQGRSGTTNGDLVTYEHLPGAVRTLARNADTLLGTVRGDSTSQSPHHDARNVQQPARPWVRSVRLALTPDGGHGVMRLEVLPRSG